MKKVILPVFMVCMSVSLKAQQVQQQPVKTVSTPTAVFTITQAVSQNPFTFLQNVTVDENTLLILSIIEELKANELLIENRELNVSETECCPGQRPPVR